MYKGSWATGCEGKGNALYGAFLTNESRSGLCLCMWCMCGRGAWKGKEFVEVTVNIFATLHRRIKLSLHPSETINFTLSDAVCLLIV